MPRPLSGSHTAGRQRSKRLGESSPSPRGGQPPAGCLSGFQRPAQLARGSTVPRPSERATQAAPSAAA
eukprot:13962897-Alexandrium_andersonii.AAC.1